MELINSEKKYYQEIDALKGWAIFIVILVHSIIVYPINLHDNPYCQMLFNFGSSFEMPLFFLISGLCFSYKGNYKEFIMKKVWRIAIPYLIFYLIDMCFRLAIPSLVNKNRNFLNSIIGLLLGNEGPYWFLYALFVIFAIYPLFYEALNKFNSRRMAYGYLCVLLALSCYGLNIALLRLDRVANYIFWFALGQQMKSWWNFETFKINSVIKRNSLILVVLAIWLYLLFDIGFTNIILSKFITLLGIGFSFLIVQFDWFKNLFEGFGKYSLQLYLLNGFFLTLSRTIICKYFHINDPTTIIVSITIICFGISYLFIKYFCSKFVLIRLAMGI